MSQRTIESALDNALGALFAARMPDLDDADAACAARVMRYLLEENTETADENFAAYAILSIRRGDGWATRFAAQAMLLAFR